MGFEIITRTHVGCRRKVNEDALAALPDRQLWVVADGMGGHDAGDVASAAVIEDLTAPEPPDLPLDDRVAEGRRRLDATNARLVALAGEYGDRRTIGSTVVVLMATQDRFAALWAGDSRGYLRRDGRLEQLTHDHSLVQDLVDMGEITPAEARDQPNANVITRAVGAARGLQLDLVEGEIRAGDAFLLATDGLTRLATDEELSVALGAPDLAAAADGLVELCLQRGAPDNLTFVIVRAG